MAKRVIKSATPFPFEKIGDSISGTFERLKEIQFEDKETPTKGAIITTKDGESRIVWLSALLEDLFDGIAPGETVEITLTGVKPSKIKGRSPTKLYTVSAGE